MKRNIIRLCEIFSIAIIISGCSNPVSQKSDSENSGPGNLGSGNSGDSVLWRDANEIIYNPDVGFYSAMDIKVEQNGIYDFAWKKEVIGNQSATLYNGSYNSGATFNLIHLKFDISDFSKNGYLRDSTSQEDAANRTDKELTSAALSDISGLLDSLRTGEKTAIVRFAYDPGYSGKTYKDNGKDVYYDIEPKSVDMILKHIEQLCPTLIEHSDVITAIECGMVGPWGEMHGTTMAKTDGNIKKIMTQFLDCLKDCEIPFLVRQPAFIYDYLSLEHSTTVPSYSVVKGSKDYKLGLYNDGYLGSDSDSGTFRINRGNEIAFMKQFTDHTPYGGELIGDYGLTSASGFSGISEMNDVHLSFLNIGWNDSVLLKLKSDNKYRYDEESSFDYIIKHMGYRFVLEEPVLDTVGRYIKFDLKIENNGFANLPMHRRKQLKILICKKGNTDIVIQHTHDKTLDSSDEKEFAFSIENIDTSTLEIGSDYDVYLKVCNSDGKYAIRFVNPSSNWNETLKANYVGSFHKF